MANESVRQNIVFEILKALCSSGNSLDYAPHALVKRAEEITDELMTKFGGSNAS